MSTRKDQYLLNMPDGMRQTLKKMAEENMRSMSAEIILALKKWIASQNEKAGEAA